MTERTRTVSLQWRLAAGLGLVYVVGIAVALTVLFYQAYEAAETLNERELAMRAKDLARLVKKDAAGTLTLRSALNAPFTGSSQEMVAIRGQDGRVIAASSEAFAERVSGWPAGDRTSHYFKLDRFGPDSRSYEGMNATVDSEAGPLWISIARPAGDDALAHSMLREFVTDISWIIPIIIAVTLGAGIIAIRSGLRPVTEVSRIAAGIDPGTLAVRLPEREVPTEIAPLVSAMNKALGRLEQGFVLQRTFTANAAHELRTPLAIIAAALEAIQGNGELAKIKADVSRMSRLVDQLLGVARLDAVALDVSKAVDLDEIARTTVTGLAPWAVAQGRSLEFIGSQNPVPIRGNGHAIEDALRNLVENAVACSPQGGEIAIRVSDNGQLTVADRGQGIPPEDRERIFERFWRGRGAKNHGAGLGLAIVAEIVKAHRASVEVSDNPGGGAVFSIRFNRDP